MGGFRLLGPGVGIRDDLADRHFAAGVTPFIDLILESCELDVGLCLRGGGLLEVALLVGERVDAGVRDCPEPAVRACLNVSPRSSLAAWHACSLQEFMPGAFPAAQ